MVLPSVSTGEPKIKKALLVRAFFDFQPGADENLCSELRHKFVDGPAVLLLNWLATKIGSLSVRSLTGQLLVGQPKSTTTS